MYYLLGWNPAINAKDRNGNTPLHIACKFADKWDELRSIKELLMKGAYRFSLNNLGETPIALVEKYVEDLEIKDTMRQLLVSQN
jgi:ankyrin repeat protein